jgi:hypothetical protein
MANTNEGETPVTVHQNVPAPAPTQWVMPHQKEIEVSSFSSPTSVRYPQIRGGICEFCGVMDGSKPSEMQYKMCPHYRGQQMRCVYCPRDKDADEVINHAVLNVAEHPENPNKLVVWCDSYECSKKHRERFSVSLS